MPKKIEITPENALAALIASKTLSVTKALIDARGISPTRDQLAEIPGRIRVSAEFLASTNTEHSFDELAKSVATLLVDEIFGMDKALS